MVAEFRMRKSAIVTWRWRNLLSIDVRCRLAVRDINQVPAFCYRQIASVTLEKEPFTLIPK